MIIVSPENELFYIGGRPSVTMVIEGDVCSVDQPDRTSGCQLGKMISAGCFCPRCKYDMIEALILAMPGLQNVGMVEAPEGGLNEKR